LKDSVTRPIYAQIAIDVASRIARGDLKRHSKIYGRSVLSSEYGVSPETIRRALRLLEDMNIIEIKKNSGIIILSADNAAQYVERFGMQNDIRMMQKKLNELISQQENLNREIVEVAGNIVRINERFSQTYPFNTYEVEIPENSNVIGKTLAELKFWQQTGATVIAVRRNDNIIHSPGPYFALEANDVLIFVSSTQNADVVKKVVDSAN